MPPEGVPLIQQSASENLLRLDMYSLSYPSLAQPQSFMRQVLNDVFLRKSDSQFL